MDAWRGWGLHMGLEQVVCSHAPWQACPAVGLLSTLQGW
jgi:hypothetical protein